MRNDVKPCRHFKAVLVILPRSWGARLESILTGNLLFHHRVSENLKPNKDKTNSWCDQVELRTSVPMYAVGLTALLSVLLSLINFGSSVVFEDLVSPAIAGLYSSYLVATALLLFRRCTGGIRLYNDSDKTLTNTLVAPLTWGPWHVPGIVGIILNIFVCAFLAVAWFFSFWPSDKAVTASTMNYNCLVWGSVVILSMLYYLTKGRKEYSGPIIEADESDVYRVVPAKESMGVRTEITSQKRW